MSNSHLLSGNNFMISKSGGDNFYLNCTFSFLYSLHSNSMLLTGQIKWATIRLVERQDLMTLKPNCRATGLLHLQKYVLAWKSVMISDSWQYHMLVNPCTVCWRKESLLPPMWAEQTGNHWSPIHRYNQDATMRDLIYMTLIMIIWLLALVLSATNWSVMRQLLCLMTCLYWIICNLGIPAPILTHYTVFIYILERKIFFPPCCFFLVFNIKIIHLVHEVVLIIWKCHSVGAIFNAGGGAEGAIAPPPEVKVRRITPPLPPPNTNIQSKAVIWIFLIAAEKTKGTKLSKLWSIKNNFLSEIKCNSWIVKQVLHVVHAISSTRRQKVQEMVFLSLNSSIFPAAYPWPPRFQRS